MLPQTGSPASRIWKQHHLPLCMDKEDLIYHAAASQLGGLKWNKDDMVTLPIGLSKGTGSAFQKLVVAVQLVYPVKIQGDDCNRPAHSHRC